MWTLLSIVHSAKDGAILPVTISIVGAELNQMERSMEEMTEKLKTTQDEVRGK